MIRLFCFPFAGGSSAAYEGWSERLPGVEVCAIELPGRRALFGQPPLRRLDAIVDHVLGAVAARIRGRFAVYGHSMGAVTALEVLRALARRGEHAECLVVSGCAAPHVPSRRPRPLHTLPADELLEELRALETVPEPLLRKRDVLDAFLPTIRADMESRETWRAEVSDIRTPIHAVGGRDDALVSLADLREWGRYTSAGFRATQLDGGHFFIRSNQHAFLRLLQSTLQNTQRELHDTPSPQGDP
ncbi:thioesterase II family protein [Pendulispora albinea]|uniref:Alpha/beta fold hydrolase n=1 Tax=Pendulispora albinea TaxID=2741071 RepID=A0ABZ2M556_9BACT